MSKTLIFGGLALIVVLGLGISLPRTTTIVERVQDSLGALPSNDIVENRISIGGTDFYSYTSPMRPNTNMPCSFRTPAATTTLLSASGDFRVGTSSSQTVYIGTSANNTTLASTLVSQTLGSGAKGSISYAGGSTTVQIAPSQYIVVNVPGGATASAPQGTCTAYFQVISK